MTDTGATKTLPCDFDVLAPDGSEVRLLLSLPGGSMAHFRLPPGQTSLAVRHRSVEEIWYIVDGIGEMWRSVAGQEEIVRLSAGTSLTIPTSVSFQFRSGAEAALTAVAVTMPPWPGESEAEFVAGKWPPTVS